MTELPPDLPDQPDEHVHEALPDDDYELYDTDELGLAVDQGEFTPHDETWATESQDDGDSFPSTSSDVDEVLLPVDTDGTGEVVDETVDEERPVGLVVTDGDDDEDEIRLPVGQTESRAADVSTGEQASDDTGSTDPDLGTDPAAHEPDPLVELPDLGHGLCDPSIVGQLADALGANTDAGALDELLADALATDPDLAYGLDGRSAVRLLEGVGVSAGLEHGTLDTLTDHLRVGRVVMIGMGDPGEGLRISAIDEESGSLTCLDAAGGGWEVDLDEFLAAWDAAASEMLVADELSSAAGTTVSLGAPGFTVLPMALPEGATPLIETD